MARHKNQHIPYWVLECFGLVFVWFLGGMGYGLQTTTSPGVLSWARDKGIFLFFFLVPILHLMCYEVISSVGYYLLYFTYYNLAVLYTVV